MDYTTANVFLNPKLNLEMMQEKDICTGLWVCSLRAV